MRHEALPQSKTAEELGVWLTNEAIERKTHREEVEYTDEEIQEFEHKSSVASRALDKLKHIEDDFKKMIKEGVEKPVDVTVPPTKGTKILESRRKHADSEIEKGYYEDTVDLYGIPYPEGETILFFDNEGNIWDSYTLEMTVEQKEQYVGLFKAGKNLKDTIEELEEGGTTVTITTSEGEEVDTDSGEVIEGEKKEDSPEEVEPEEEPAEEAEENQVNLDINDDEEEKEEPVEQTSELEEGDIDLSIEPADEKTGSF